jgi:hypothetical protein
MLFHENGEYCDEVGTPRGDGAEPDPDASLFGGMWPTKLEALLSRHAALSQESGYREGLQVFGKGCGLGPHTRLSREISESHSMLLRQRHELYESVAEHRLREAAVAVREQHLTEREGQLRAKEQVCQKTECTLEEARRRFEAKEAWLQHKQAELEVREFQACSREKELREKEALVCRREEDLTERESHAYNREEGLRVRESQACSREGVLEERESQAFRREEDLERLSLSTAREVAVLESRIKQQVRISVSPYLRLTLPIILCVGGQAV